MRPWNVYFGLNNLCDHLTITNLLRFLLLSTSLLLFLLFHFFSTSGLLCRSNWNRNCSDKDRNGKCAEWKNSLPLEIVWTVHDDYNSITQISNANLCMPNSSCTALKLLTRGDEEIAKRPQKPVERMSWMLKLPHTNKSTWLENGTSPCQITICLSVTFMV